MPSRPGVGQTGAPGDLAEGEGRVTVYCDETKTPTGPGQPTREGPPAQSDQYTDRTKTDPGGREATPPGTCKPGPGPKTEPTRPPYPQVQKPS